MLKNIKSSYFIQIIFFHINNDRKLKLIKYNKNLQNEINVNINDYKIFSGRYIIYETKEIGKEYNIYNDELIFEGEYING